MDSVVSVEIMVNRSDSMFIAFICLNAITNYFLCSKNKICCYAQYFYVQKTLFFGIVTLLYQYHLQKS